VLPVVVDLRRHQRDPTQHHRRTRPRTPAMTKARFRSAMHTKVGLRRFVWVRGLPSCADRLGKGAARTRSLAATRGFRDGPAARGHPVGNRARWAGLVARATPTIVGCAATKPASAAVGGAFVCAVQTASPHTPDAGAPTQK